MEEKTAKIFLKTVVEEQTLNLSNNIFWLEGDTSQFFWAIKIRQSEKTEVTVSNELKRRNEELLNQISNF